ncbi:MAG TPA: hypothetical protein PKW55_03775 [Spirochaetota bacterium]|nr:hypothetical protein [Spirochaetota bacterium]HOM38046.1 hypothetical protein [Spirochaetota bacterium]HPQ48850.1 hypothetical protein [Spirochaetota bacterium]
MRKIMILIFLIILTNIIYSYNIGIVFSGGLGWGGGVFNAYEGSQIYPTYKGPYGDTAYSYDYGFGFYYKNEDIFGNFIFTFSTKWSTKRFKVLYEKPDSYNTKEDWTDYREYTLLSKFLTFSLGTRYYTYKEFLFGGEVFFGGGVYYAFSRGNMEIEVKDISVNDSWFAKIMLFNVLSMARKDVSDIYKGSDSGLSNDEGFFLEAGLNWPKGESFFFEFFVNYYFSLTRVYKPQEIMNMYHIHIKDYSPRTFLMNFSFGFYL